MYKKIISIGLLVMFSSMTYAADTMSFLYAADTTSFLNKTENRYLTKRYCSNVLAGSYPVTAGGSCLVCSDKASKNIRAYRCE